MFFLALSGIVSRPLTFSHLSLKFILQLSIMEHLIGAYCPRLFFTWAFLHFFPDNTDNVTGIIV